MSSNDTNAEPRETDGKAERPTWRRPICTILDVEAGTVTTSGPVADTNGSTS